MIKPITELQVACHSFLSPAKRKQTGARADPNDKKLGLNG